MPVFFTLHGSPIDIPLSKKEKPFWNSLFELGIDLPQKYEIKAALIVSAYWYMQGTFVNISPQQIQIYFYYGFPEEHYQVKYQSAGAPDIASETKRIVPSVIETPNGGWIMVPGPC